MTPKARIREARLMVLACVLMVPLAGAYLWTCSEILRAGAFS